MSIGGKAGSSRGMESRSRTSIADVDVGAGGDDDVGVAVRGSMMLSRIAW